ncbi:ORC-CDC6 family AAA ATPase [Methylobacterium oryzae CBMB20]
MARYISSLSQDIGAQMRTERHEQNPFDMVKASDFTDEEILDHWVDISGEHGKLEDIIKPRLVMPMLLLGGKGSGKTHLMRYFSAPVQAARFDGDLLKAVSNEKYLGIYVRAEGLNTQKFNGKGQSDEAWSAIFSMYFEVWLATSLLQNVSSSLSDKTSAIQGEEFARLVSGLFDIDVAGRFSSFDSCIGYLTEIRKSTDLIVNNASLTRDISGLSIDFSPGSLVFGLPEILAKVWPELRSVLFVYLVDEVENLTSDQQRFLNTLIRYRKGNASLKVGARLYGMRTYNTLGVGEPIKRDAEYERVELDSFLRDNQSAYADFCKKLVIRRLEYHNMRPPRLTADSLAACFAEVKAKDYSRESTLELVSTWDSTDRDRPYFTRFESLLKKGGMTQN